MKDRISVLNKAYKREQAGYDNCALRMYGAAGAYNGEDKKAA